MCTKNVRRPSFRTRGSGAFSSRPTARNLARYGTQTSDTFGYNTRSESPRWLGGGLDKHKVFAPKGRAGNGVPASHPTQPTATRPLAIQKNGTWYTYGWDLTKNICETYRTDARIDLAYTYTPYGEVSPAHAYDQPLRWSSEYHDVELGLVYYNYRHYNSFDGRWGGRDPISAFMNQYIYCANSFYRTDFIGLLTRNERNRDRVLNTISVGVTLEWWDDLASDIAIRIARNIASNEKDKWITTAVLTCNENEGGHYSKPTVDWGPIVPQNIGVRRTFAFNRGGYEHYVPISNRYVK